MNSESLRFPGLNSPHNRCDSHHMKELGPDICFGMAERHRRRILLQL
jgi:hypothetical protein